jgi:hypothetical protein
MVIWRLQNEYGVGPYSSLGFTLLERHQGSNSHPGINPDTNGKFCRGMICGFPKYGKLKKWFGEYLPELKNLGFKVVKVKVLKKNVLFGKSGKQVAFYREDIYHENSD